MCICVLTCLCPTVNHSLALSPAQHPHGFVCCRRPSDDLFQSDFTCYAAVIVQADAISIMATDAINTQRVSYLTKYFSNVNITSLKTEMSSVSKNKKTLISSFLSFSSTTLG